MSDPGTVFALSMGDNVQWYDTYCSTFMIGMIGPALAVTPDEGKDALMANFETVFSDTAAAKDLITDISDSCNPTDTCG